MGKLKGTWCTPLTLHFIVESFTEIVCVQFISVWSEIVRCVHIYTKVIPAIPQYSISLSGGWDVATL